MIDISHLIDVLAPISCCQTPTKMLFGSCFTQIIIQKDEQLPPPRERTLYFLATGILHEYFETNGNETSTSNSEGNSTTTIRFYHGGQFFPRSGSSYELTLPNSNIVALCPCQLYTCTYQQIIDCYHRDPAVAELFLNLQDQWNERLNEELLLLHEEPAFLRYQKFRDQVPEPYQIPQKYLASYLNISRKHLGRLNKQFLKIK